MIKVVVDTNVFISAAIGKGYSKLIVEQIFSDPQIQLCISNKVLGEFERVIEYPRLIKKDQFKEQANRILDNIRIFGVLFKPTISITILKDASDNKFLELALAANADYLITGNHLDFNLLEYQGVKIVSPKIFWEQHVDNA